MADTAHRLTDEKLEEMEKRLSAIYSRAEKEIQKTADEYFSKFAKQNEAKRKLLEQGIITEDEYKKWRKGKVMYGKRFTEMKEQCAKKLLNVNQTAIAYVNGELPEVYALNYNAIAGSVDGVGGYSFTLVDADTVRNLAVTDTSLLPYKEIDPAKDIPWNMKNINAEVLQGILQGESMGDIAKRIGNVQEMNKNAAIRTARTMVTGAENRGRQDSYARAEADGIMLEKEWVATFDYRTRHAHALLDGQTQDVDKPFKSELGDIMFPGDPAAAGANVYNCRCTMVSHVVGFNGKKLYDNPAADRETVADLLEKEKEKDPETFAIETKKAYNKGSDHKQYEKYKERLGKDMPKGGFQSFRDMKYNDPEKYEDLKAFYRYKGISPESDRRFFEANKAVDKLRAEKKIRAKGEVVPAPRNIIIKDINTHAKERLSERGFTIESSQKIVDLSDFALRQRNGEQHSFYCSEGFATVDNDGLLRTVGSLDDGGKLLYDEVMKYVQRSK